MCRRFTMLTWDETISVVRSLEAHAPLNPIPDWPARRIDAFPDAEVGVIVGGGCAQICRACPFPCNGSQHRPDESPRSTSNSQRPFLHGTLDVRSLRWGYPMPPDGKLVFNTRLERAPFSPLWSDSFEKRRCIVPVAAFYETSSSEYALNPTGRKVKQVYRFGCGKPAGGEDGNEGLGAITEADGSSVKVRPLLLGGIWQGDRFSIVTTEPNEVVRPVHDRMPLALSAKGALAWLAGNTAAEQLASSDMESTALYPTAPEQGQLTLF